MLFTDYTFNGPYVGQLKARLQQGTPAEWTVDLMHDAPPFQPRRAAYLLAACRPYTPPSAVILAVVDPGVGSERAGCAVRVGSRWLVGPDNGLLAIAARAAAEPVWYSLPEPGPEASATFHGRDVFADAARRLAVGERAALTPFSAEAAVGAGWPADCDETIYADGLGNVMTGRRAQTLPQGAVMQVGGHRLGRARTFSDCPEGGAFWYENAMGLAEVAVNQGRADALEGLGIGVPCTWERP